MTFKKATSALVHTAVTTALFLAASVATAQTSTTYAARNRGVAAGVDLPNAPVYALTSDNAIYVLRPGAANYARLGRVETEGGNLIGIDFRPADGKLYGLTDLGVLYTDRSGKNYLVGQTTRLLFSIDLSQVNPNLPVGQTQKIVVKRGLPAALPGSTAPLTGGVWDIALPPAQ